jgi:hypothetical protein
MKTNKWKKNERDKKKENNRIRFQLYLECIEYVRVLVSLPSVVNSVELK